MKMLVLSNGHGEDLIAIRIIERLQQHIADIERARPLDSGVVERRANRRCAQVAQAAVPVLTDRRLADAKDEDVVHRSVPVHAMRILRRSCRYSP